MVVRPYAALLVLSTLLADATAPAAGAPREAQAIAGGSHVGAGIALARVGARDVAFVADEDDSSVHAFDVDGPRELGVTDLGGKPGQILVTPGGRIFVAVRDKNEVRAFGTGDDGKLVAQGAVATAADPYGLALSPDGATLLVTSGWGAELASVSVANLRVNFRVALAREPRGVLFASDGKLAYVTHLVAGTISAVALTLPAHPVATLEAPGSFVAPAWTGRRVGGHAYAIAKSGDTLFVPEAFGAVSQVPPGYYGGAMEISGFLSFSERSPYSGTSRMVPLRPPSPRSMPAAAPLSAAPECLLPRALTVRSAVAKPTLLLGCLGSSFVHEFDATGAMAFQRSIAVDGAPTAIAYDAKSDTLVSWSQERRRFQVVSLSAPATPPLVVAASGHGLASPELELGRALFIGAGDRRLANDGRACASCHPEGRDDGRVWMTPEGPRQTAMLAGRLEGTAPYGWTRDAPTVKEYIKGTISRLKGSGLAEAELGALTAYVTSLSPPVVARVESTAVRRGGEIFRSPKAGCSRCHAGAALTDGQRHAVAKPAPEDDTERTFETPSLRFVGATAPYFHDGRYATLRDLLTDPDGRMGALKHLTPADLSALEAYLGSL